MYTSPVFFSLLLTNTFVHCTLIQRFWLQNIWSAVILFIWFLFNQRIKIHNKSNENTEECSRHHYPCDDIAVVVLLSVIQTTDWGGTSWALGPLNNHIIWASFVANHVPTESRSVFHPFLLSKRRFQTLYLIFFWKLHLFMNCSSSFVHGPRISSK